MNDTERIERFLYLADQHAIWGRLNPFWKATIQGHLLRDAALTVTTIDQLIHLWRELDA